MKLPQFSRLLLALFVLLALGCHDYNFAYEVPTGEIRLFDDLYSVSVVDDENAVAVGYYGAAYYTSDGGESWAKGETGTRSSLYKVSMADSRIGWAVGQRGLILRTEDGGETWARQPNMKEEEGTHLFGVSAIDQKTAWVVGEWGTRIRTRDGGATWEDHSFTIDEMHPQFVWLLPADQEKVREGGKVYDDVSLGDVDCQPAPGRNCWLIGEYGYIYYSRDSGETWMKSEIEGSIKLAPIELAYNQIEVAEADIASLREFADKVKDLSHLKVGVAPVTTAREIREFGQPEDPTELFEILEARLTEVRTLLEEADVPYDRLRNRGQPPWDYEDFLEDDPRFLARYLEGRTRASPGVEVRVIHNPILYTVRFRDEQNGLIAGLGGIMLRSNDGGETWAYRRIDREQAMFSVDGVRGRAVAVGEKGLVRFSVDDGDSWVQPPSDALPSVFTFMRDVEFEPTGRVGFIVGQTGLILRTVDSGQRWQQVLPDEATPSV